MRTITLLTALAILGFTIAIKEFLLPKGSEFNIYVICGGVAIGAFVVGFLDHIISGLMPTHEAYIEFTNKDNDDFIVLPKRVFEDVETVETWYRGVIKDYCSEKGDWVTTVVNGVALVLHNGDQDNLRQIIKTYRQAHATVIELDSAHPNPKKQKKEAVETNIPNPPQQVNTDLIKQWQWYYQKALQQGDSHAINLAASTMQKHNIPIPRELNWGG